MLSSEPMLFSSMGSGVHHPETCTLPDDAVKKNLRRRLGESLMTQKDAEAACAHASEEDFKDCIFDVLATNDEAVAGTY